MRTLITLGCVGAIAASTLTMVLLETLPLGPLTFEQKPETVGTDIMPIPYEEDDTSRPMIPFGELPLWGMKEAANGDMWYYATKGVPVAFRFVPESAEERKKLEGCWSIFDPATMEKAP